MGDPVTWFEFIGPDPDGTAKFYGELFGWHTEAIPDGTYTLIDTHAGSGINGGLASPRGDEAPYSVFYAENPDIQAVLDKAEGLGAKTVLPVTEAMGVTFAQFVDPFGNLIGLAQGDGSVRVSEGDHVPVDWFELSSPQPEKAWDFYRELFGWNVKPDSGEGFAHASIDTGGGIRGGIGSSPDGQPRTTMYAAVDDLQKYLERAETLGAIVVMPPTQVDEHTKIAVFTDPQGTAFGMYAYQE
jgi:uncharacterized protein